MLAEIVVEISRAHMLLKPAKDMKRVSVGTLETEERLRKMWSAAQLDK